MPHDFLCDTDPGCHKGSQAIVRSDLSYLDHKHNLGPPKARTRAKERERRPLWSVNLSAWALERAEQLINK